MYSANKQFFKYFSYFHNLLPDLEHVNDNSFVDSKCYPPPKPKGEEIIQGLRIFKRETLLIDGSSTEEESDNEDEVKDIEEDGKQELIKELAELE